MNEAFRIIVAQLARIAMEKSRATVRIVAVEFRIGGSAKRQQRIEGAKPWIATRKSGER
jgi:hypothetical protein